MVVYGIFLLHLFVVNVDCEGSWVATGKCNAECDGNSAISEGLEDEVYQITVPHENEGAACEATDGEKRSMPCKKTDCGGTIF